MILAIETSGLVCGAALHDGNDIVAIREDERPRIHDIVLDEQIRGVCRDAGISVEQIEAIACSIGPGSFTGIRIGLSMAKGLCFALQKPLIPVPTLDAMAFAARGRGTGRIIAALSAEADKCYVCQYDAVGERLEEYQILRKGELSPIEDGALVIGTASSYFTELRNATDAEVTAPRVRYIADYGVWLFARGVAKDPAETEPLYVAAVVHAPAKGAKTQLFK